MNNLVLLVNENDEPIGGEDKLIAHQKGKLHRAFSIIILNNKGRMLIQRRANGKYHSGGLWSNACCSHPSPTEEINLAVHKRLQEELCFDCKLKKIFIFHYKKEVGNKLIENEIDHVFIGRYDGYVKINRKEAEAYRWIKMEELIDEIKEKPEKYTVWFKIIMDKFSKSLEEKNEDPK